MLPMAYSTLDLTYLQYRSRNGSLTYDCINILIDREIREIQKALHKTAGFPRVLEHVVLRYLPVHKFLHTQRAFRVIRSECFWKRLYMEISENTTRKDLRFFFQWV